MSKKEKLEKKFFSNPIIKTLEWNELTALLKHHGFEAFSAPGGSSKVKFFNEEFNLFVSFHKPHPGNLLKEYVIKETRQLINNKKELEKKGKK